MCTPLMTPKQVIHCNIWMLENGRWLYAYIYKSKLLQEDFFFPGAITNLHLSHVAGEVFTFVMTQIFCFQLIKLNIYCHMKGERGTTLNIELVSLTI